MNFYQDKEWDLTKNRPKVLFLGNGLFYSDSTWDKFIENNKKEDLSEREWAAIENAPYTIRGTAAMAVEDDMRQKGYLKEIASIHEKMEKNRKEVLDLLELPFDAILTTNYTYQIENHIDSAYCELTNEQKRNKYAKQTFRNEKGEPRDVKYLLQTFNQLEYNGVLKNIWHIHGEARRKTSIVATHDEYGKVMEKIRSYCEKQGYFYQYKRNAFRFKSWIDYLILGDVYFIGTKLDYTEFDLWWLFSRRIREKPKCGNMIYYNPKEQSIEKETIFNLLQIKEISLNSYLTKNFDYASFYKKVIEDIKNRILP